MAKRTVETGPTEVFVSVGRCCTPSQEQLVGRVFDFVRKAGLRPLSSRHGDDWPATGTVEALREVMDRAAGTFVVAFERKVIERGRELPTATIDDELLTTVWNQVEAGMACATRHPILVLMDSTLRQEGLLDRNFPWHVESTELAKFDPHAEAFARTFASFVQQMDLFRQTRGKRRLTRGSRETIAEVFGSFSPEQLQLLGSLCLGTLGATASVAYFLGHYFAR